LVNRWGLTWLQQPEDAWRKKYPHITKKIDNLEKRLKEIETNPYIFNTEEKNEND
jgi:hypothetical protein